MVVSAGFQHVGASGQVPDPSGPPDDGARRQRYLEMVAAELPVLLRVARTMTGQSADAEDLVQDTLLRAWHGLDGFDGRHPRAWLLTILRHTEINRHRRRRPELLDDPDEPAGRHLAAAHPSAEQVVTDRAFDAVVEAALLALPEDMRRVVMLIDVDELSYAEAAAILGVPEGTVTSRLHRARKRIRHSLQAGGLAPRRGL